MLGQLALSYPVSARITTIDYISLAIYDTTSFQLAQVERSGLLVALPLVKVEWKFVSVVYGEQCAMITGVQQMLKLSADS